MSVLRHSVDRLSHNGEAGVSQRYSLRIGIEHLHRRATTRVIDGEVVGDDPLLLELINEILNLLCLIGSSLHDSHDAVCETFCRGHCGRITLDLNFLGSSSR